MRKSIGKFLLLSALSGLVLSAPAQADVGCSFNVTSVAIDTNGSLNVSFQDAAGNYKWWYICNTAGTMSVNNGYGPVNIAADSCKSMHTQMLTARASSRPIVLWFHGPTDCAAASLPASGTLPSPFPTNFAF